MNILQVVVLALAIVLTCFYLWNESRKDGFDEEKVLDIFLISLVCSYIVAKMLYFLMNRTFVVVPVLDEIPYYFLGFGAGAWYMSRRYGWSLFRVSDILTLAFLFGAGAFFILTSLLVRFNLLYLILSFCLFVASFLLAKYRNVSLKSGYIFIIITILLALVSLSRLGDVKNLPFPLFLITLSLLAIRYRLKVDMIKPRISSDLFKHLVGRLKIENLKLKKEEEHLKKQDPYMKEGRTSENSELVDDAMEDVDKTYHEARLNLVQTARMQVRRALAKVKIGTYGVCESCHMPIDLARLKAYPQATKCLECSEKTEE